MRTKIEDIKKMLSDYGLKATVQRIVILETMLSMKTHPTAEEIFDSVKLKIPTVSLSTIYNTLDSFIEKKLINTVKNDTGIIRYDAFLDSHHHLYSESDGCISDYYDKDLDELLINYFKNKSIPNFEIKELRLQIKGIFSKIKE